VEFFEQNYPDLVPKIEDLKKDLSGLGVHPENTYYFIQGHHLFENVALKVLIPVCSTLRKEREMEIRRLATHSMQLQNELTSYDHSQCAVELMMKKNRAIQDCEPFERLKRDLDEFLNKL
jgi:hypothetical protein